MKNFIEEFKKEIYKLEDWDGFIKRDEVINLLYKIANPSGES